MADKNRKPKRGGLFVWNGVKGFIPVISLADYGHVYRDAAKSVYQSFQTQQGGLGAHPIVFLYRHATEAYLKAILLDFGSPVGVTRKQVRAWGHRLSPLVAAATKVACEGGQSLSLDSITTICHFQDADPSGVRFRYAYEGSEKYDKVFDLERFVAQLELALDELHNLHDTLSHELLKEIESKILSPR